MSIKRSFTVLIRDISDKPAMLKKKTRVVLGVVAIFPNLNGFLINCEVRHKGLQIEHWDMSDQEMTFQYTTEEANEFMANRPAEFTVIDGREDFIYSDEESIDFDDDAFEFGLDD